MSGAEGPDTFVSIGELCRRFGFSRQTFYRMFNDPDGGLDEVAVRVPPPRGRLRIPVRRFEAWLRARRDDVGAGETFAAVLERWERAFGDERSFWYTPAERAALREEGLGG